MPKEHIVGMYRKLRRSSVEDQQRRLEQADCGRIWSWDERERLLRYLRDGDVVVVTQAQCLGQKWREIEALMTQVFKRGATIEVLEPPMKAETIGAAKIAFKAMSGLEGDRRAHLPEEARRCGLMNRKYYEERRTKESVARRFWNSRRALEMTVDQRLMQPEMDGWSRVTAYRILGAPKRKTGAKRRT